MIKNRVVLLVIIALAMLVTSLTACLDSDENAPSTSPSPTTASPEPGPTIETSVRPTPTPTLSPTPEPSPTQPPPPPSPAPSAVASFSLARFSEEIADIVERVKPAVVLITAEIQGRDFFNRIITRSASGSGVMMSPEGYILTNNHVVEGAAELRVAVPNRTGDFPAKLIGADPLTDLAVIKIEGQGFPTAVFGDASKVRAGNLVLAIGYPLALEHGTTTSLGIVSNTERSFTLGESTYYDVMQIDAPINPGNSGGALINMNGEVVGINAVVASGAQNIGFTISVSTAKPVYEALMTTPNRVVRPWMGAVFETVTAEMAAEERLSRNSGVAVLSVERGSPSERAGLRVRDIITGFDGNDVSEATQLIKELWRRKVGDQVTITYWRNGEQREMTIELSVERPR